MLKKEVHRLTMEQENLHNIKKKVDEAWKEAVYKEKENLEQAKEKQAYPTEVNFGIFISGLMVEGLIALGDIEDPLTKKKQVNLDKARYIIDTISMLKDKTSGNLTKDEEGAVEHILYDLRRRYISKSK